MNMQDMQAAPTAPVLSIAVALFQAEHVVEELIRRIDTAAAQTKLSYEIVTLDDGSRDATAEKARLLRRTFPALRTYRLRRNFGQMSAIAAALSLTRGDAVIVLDDDLQDPPELIPELVAEWKKGANVVNARRISTDDGPVKTLGTSLFYLLMERFAGAAFPRNISTFCLIDRPTVRLILAMPEVRNFFTGQRMWVGGKHAEITYARQRRRVGRSGLGLSGHIRLARTAIYGFSSKPLIGAALFSLISACLMLVIGLTAIGIRLFTDLAIPGWATFTTLIGFLGFTQSLVLMMLSEYIAIIYDETKRRPLYLLEEDNGHPAP